MKVTQPYEILFRFRDGQFSGGHIKDIEKFIDDDGETVILERETSARAIYTDGQEYAVILSSINTGVMAENDSLKAEKTTLLSRIAELEAQLPE